MVAHNSYPKIQEAEMMTSFDFPLAYPVLQAYTITPGPKLIFK